MRSVRVTLYSALLTDDDIEECMNYLLQRMKDDECKMCVMEDHLIRVYAALRTESLGSKVDQKINDIHRVSQSCRLLARLVLEARKTKPLITLDALIKPENFYFIIRLVKQMTFNP